MITRRQMLRTGLVIGCSAAAHPLMSTVTLAGSDGGRPLGERRLVVIILRGAMDGLDLVQPMGDPGWAALRPGLMRPDAPGLAGPFHLHPEARLFQGLWQEGQLAFVHATSTPYRDRRSHFQGQDMLEAGTGMDLDPAAVRDGWLNRMLQAVPGLRAETAFAIGREDMKILQGPAAVMSWAPELALDISPQMARLLEAVYHDDDLFREAGAEALALDGMMEEGGAMMGGGGKTRAHQRLARFAAERLMEETRIAAFSLGGWDTHRGQKNGFADGLAALEAMIAELRQGLTPGVWGQTAVLCLTEFGRTARENGSGGTDHGTGSVMIAAGGAVRGGQVLGRWPGLADGALYQGRDLMPTSDVRAWAAHVIGDFYGLDRTLLESTIFPGLRFEGETGLLL